MTIREMSADLVISTLALQRESWASAAAYLRRRAPDDQMVRRLMLELEDAVRDLDDVIGNLRAARTRELRAEGPS